MVDDPNYISLPVQLLYVIGWICAVSIVSATAIIIRMFNAVRDAAQQAQLSRDSIIKNERANILIGVHAGKREAGCDCGIQEHDTVNPVIDHSPPSKNKQKKGASNDKSKS